MKGPLCQTANIIPDKAGGNISRPAFEDHKGLPLTPRECATYDKSSGEDAALCIGKNRRCHNPDAGSVWHLFVRGFAGDKACVETMKPEDKEILEVVDRDGNVVGLAERSDLHGNPALIHRVVHVLLFNTKGELLLQRRSAMKDVAPGKWDTSVGGHVNPGEALIDAAKREMEEELGISGATLNFLYTHFFSNHVESELVSSFACIHDGEIKYNHDEIDEVAFWGLDKIKENMGKGVFSRHFEEEIAAYRGVKG